MARKKGRDRDVVSELQEDARWSSYTNSVIRWHHTAGGGGAPRSSLSRTARIWIWVVVVSSVMGIVWSVVAAVLTDP
jgi:hypothetical protein